MKKSIGIIGHIDAGKTTLSTAKGSLASMLATKLDVTKLAVDGLINETKIMEDTVDLTMHDDSSFAVMVDADGNYGATVWIEGDAYQKIIEFNKNVDEGKSTESKIKLLSMEEAREMGMDIKIPDSYLATAKNKDDAGLNQAVDHSLLFGGDYSKKLTNHMEDTMDFAREYGWKNYDRVPNYRRETPKISRNEPCTCGSGKKYKKCCINK